MIHGSATSPGHFTGLRRPGQLIIPSTLYMKNLQRTKYSKPSKRRWSDEPSPPRVAKSRNTTSKTPNPQPGEVGQDETVRAIWNPPSTNHPQARTSNYHSGSSQSHRASVSTSHSLPPCYFPFSLDRPRPAPLPRSTPLASEIEIVGQECRWLPSAAAGKLTVSSVF